jgi:hypothetical protein
MRAKATLEGRRINFCPLKRCIIWIATVERRVGEEAISENRPREVDTSERAPAKSDIVENHTREVALLERYSLERRFLQSASIKGGAGEVCAVT